MKNIFTKFFNLYLNNSQIDFFNFIYKYTSCVT